jgi:hypothetical protein
MSDAPESRDVRLAPEEEPRTTGTLVILILFLMALAAMWTLMYLVLLER